MKNPILFLITTFATVALVTSCMTQKKEEATATTGATTTHAATTTKKTTAKKKAAATAEESASPSESPKKSRHRPLASRRRRHRLHNRSVAIRETKGGIRSHTAKLSPHEQCATAFGLVTLNPPFCKSSL